jgi:hypothetical protein
MFENRMLRIFRPKTVEIMGEWRTFYGGELHNLYLSRNIIRQIKSRKMRWAGPVECTGLVRKVYKVVVGRPEGRRPLGRLEM